MIPIILKKLFGSEFITIFVGGAKLDESTFNFYKKKKNSRADKEEKFLRYRRTNVLLSGMQMRTAHNGRPKSSLVPEG